MENDEIRIEEVQSQRIWVHSKVHGFGKYIYNSELLQIIEDKKNKRAFGD